MSLLQTWEDNHLFEDEKEATLFLGALDSIFLFSYAVVSWQLSVKATISQVVIALTHITQFLLRTCASYWDPTPRLVAAVLFHFNLSLHTGSVYEWRDWG